MFRYALADLTVKRKIEKSREKVLRCDSVLQRNPFIKPIPSSIQKKKTSKKSAKAVLTAEDKDAVHGNLMVRSPMDTLLSDHAHNSVRLFLTFLSNFFRMQVLTILTLPIYGTRKVFLFYIHMHLLSSVNLTTIDSPNGCCHFLL